MTSSVVDWNAVAAIAQVAGSIATFAAVCVALKLAGEERKIRLRVEAKFMVMVNELGSADVVVVSVENIGLRPARVTFLFWSTGYRRILFRIPKLLSLKSCMQNEDWTLPLNEKMPWIVEPGNSKMTYFKRDEFLEGFKTASEGDMFRRLPFSKRFKLVNFRVGVGVTTMQKILTGNVGVSLKCALEDGYELNQQS